MTSGYSKTTLSKKLGLKANFRTYLFNAPEYYHSLFDEIPENIEYVEILESSGLDFIHAFFSSEKALKDSIISLKDGLKQNGMLWVSWPKGSSKIETDINREIVRSIVLKSGLVDIKVCAVDNDWSGLKFMYRLKDRK